MGIDGLLETLSRPSTCWFGSQIADIGRQDRVTPRPGTTGRYVKWQTMES